jgi:hypothetical protein
VTYFFDANISFKIVDALKAVGVDATHLRDHFDLAAPDEEWIPLVVAKGWIIVTVDHAIRAKAEVRKVLEGSRATTYFLTESFLDFQLLEQHAKITHVWVSIDKHRAKFRPGRLYFVRLNGKIEEM